MLRRWENTENQYWAWLHSLYLLAYREENIAPAFLLFSAHLSLGLPQCNVPRDMTWLHFTWYSNAAFQSYTNIEGEKCLQSNEVSQLSNFHLYLCFLKNMHTETQTSTMTGCLGFSGFGELSSFYMSINFGLRFIFLGGHGYIQTCSEKSFYVCIPNPVFKGWNFLYAIFLWLV